MDDMLPMPVEKGEFLLYQTEDGLTRFQVRLDNNTLWLTQAQLAELFQSSKPNISMHLRNIFADGELVESSVVKYYLTTAADGKNYQVAYYHLDAILAVGYRVRSHRGTQFRRWATGVLHEYVIKGFAMDDERLKHPGGLGDDYFDELLERIKDIRASERRFYLKVCDIYQTSTDYDPNNELTRQFFATVQNKLHYAVHGQTAAEIIDARADAGAPHMGLTTWKNAPAGPIRRDDVTVAKNYLSEDEISSLNRIVTMYLDYAEEMARRRRAMYMRDWVERLDAFLTFNERNVLPNLGSVSHEEAVKKALKEFTRYEVQRHTLADAAAEDAFEQMIAEIERKPEG